MKEIYLRIAAHLTCLGLYALLIEWMWADMPWVQQVGLWICAFFVRCYLLLLLVCVTAEGVVWWRERE